MLTVIEVMIVGVTLLMAISLFLTFVPISLLITAQAAGVPDVTPAALIRLRALRIKQERIVLPLIAAVKSGVPITLKELETHCIAGGQVDRVVQALISAQRAGIPLTFDQAAQMDLTGQDVLLAIREACQAGRKTLGEA